MIIVNESEGEAEADMEVWYECMIERTSGYK